VYPPEVTTSCPGLYITRIYRPWGRIRGNRAREWPRGMIGVRPAGPPPSSAKLHETDLAGRKPPGQMGADQARYPWALLILPDDRKLYDTKKQKVRFIPAYGKARSRHHNASRRECRCQTKVPCWEEACCEEEAQGHLCVSWRRSFRNDPM